MNIYLIPSAINQQCLVLAQVLATSGIRRSLEPAPVSIDMPWVCMVLSMYASTSLALALPGVWRDLHSLPSVDLTISDQVKERSMVSTNSLRPLSVSHRVLFDSRQFVSRRHSLSEIESIVTMCTCYGLWMVMCANSFTQWAEWLTCRHQRNHWHLPWPMLVLWLYYSNHGPRLVFRFTAVSWDQCIYVVHT